jgi:DNA (cytosine-5)-methyltransferase 1
MNVLDLFSGIGGFSLGLERAGMRTVAFCEIEPYCRAVLAKHWPSVPVYDDVRTLTGSRLRTDGISVDVICGGFPCQDISLAGRGAGLDGDRSGLWSEYRRLIAEVRPRFVIIENSPALRTRGADRVIADMEALDYTCEPFVVGAIHAGAPHRRQRAWLVAYANGAVLRDKSGRRGRENGAGASFARDYGSPGALADANGQGELQQEGLISALRRRLGDGGEHVADADSAGLEIVLDGQPGECAPALRAHAWSFEPDVGRVAYGIPSRAHRIKALGNAVVPQIPEAIGRALMTILHDERNPK